jgi:hypothetical protein
MASFSIEPDRTTYNTLLNLLAQSARFGKVFVFSPCIFFPSVDDAVGVLRKVLILTAN